MWRIYFGTARRYQCDPTEMASSHVSATQRPGQCRRQRNGRQHDVSGPIPGQFIYLCTRSKHGLRSVQLLYRIRLSWGCLNNVVRARAACPSSWSWLFSSATFASELSFSLFGNTTVYSLTWLLVKSDNLTDSNRLTRQNNSISNFNI